ncbi:TPA: LamG domain-containing protein [Candidatus Poribacteria bacterium]|nr:LamG domain-containing protein [Candidatus Poribacteria bacterium]
MRSVSIFLALLLCLCVASYSKAGVVGAWLFDEGSGTAVKDSAGKSDGKINNATWVAGKYGKALQFNGTNANVEITNTGALSVETFTLMAWVNVPGFTGGWQTIATLNTDGPIRNYGLFINDGSGLIHYSFTSNKAWQSFNAKSNIVDGKWHHIAATYDKAKFICYVDGKNDGETAINNLKPDTAVNVPVTIGSWVGGGWIKGTIDEVALFNNALTPAEIANVMNLGLSTTAVNKEGKLTTCWGDLKR